MRHKKGSAFNNVHPKMKAFSVEWQLENLVDVAETGNGQARVSAINAIIKIAADMDKKDIDRANTEPLPESLLKRIEDAGWTSKEPDVMQ